MLRQRVKSRRFALSQAALRAIVVVIALASVWYGVMTILLALKLSPHTVNELSKYRTIYHTLAAIHAGQITPHIRIIVAVVGVICFLVFAPLAWRALPRPYLARSNVNLEVQRDFGTSTVAPRAIERAAELAALADPVVRAAASRYESEDLHLAVAIDDLAGVTEHLARVRERVNASLVEHALPPLPVNVTLTNFDLSTRRSPQ